jgi:hypothetical protein
MTLNYSIEPPVHGLKGGHCHPEQKTNDGGLIKKKEKQVLANADEPFTWMDITNEGPIINVFFML